MENVLDWFGSRRLLIALQWTKRGGSATLHCNVDHGATERLLI